MFIKYTWWIMKAVYKDLRITKSNSQNVSGTSEGHVSHSISNKDQNYSEDMG